MSYDVAAEPTGVQWRQCSYFRHLRAQWMRPGSSSVKINLHYDALATEPTGVQWRQCSCFRRPRAQWMRPGSSCVEINLQYDALTSADVWAQWMLPGSNVEINLQREWLISTEYDVLASDVWWQNLLLSKFKVKTICIDVTEVIIVPWWRGEALQGHKQPISSNQTINY